MPVFNQDAPEVINHVPFREEFSPEDFKKEQECMLYQSDVDHAIDEGGSLTASCLSAIIMGAKLDRKDLQSLRIDTRVHMLKPGWFPCIPGWHADFIRRDSEGNLEFDESLDRKVRHFAVCSHQPTTTFLEGRDIEIDSEDWGEISKLIEASDLEQKKVNPGDVVEFNSNELHKGTRAQESGWRFFFRATLFPKSDPRREQFANKTRFQTQVYAPENKGW